MKKVFQLSVLCLFFCSHALLAQSPTCNINQIIGTLSGSGYTQLNVSGQPCSIYFYNNNNLTWNNAQAAAQAVGANLVTIENAAENTAITQAIVNAGLNGVVWIGFTEQNSPGTYNWIDGTPANYINWNNGEPNNSSGFPGVGEDCAQLQTNGQWNDLMCGNAGLFPAPTGRSIIEVSLCPQINATGPSAVVCQNSPVSLNASAQFGSTPYTYAWFVSPNTTPVATGQSYSPSPAANTVYVAAVQDRYGCSDTAQIPVATQNCNVNTTCDLAGIRAAFTAAGYQELPVSGQSCSVYFVNPNSQDADQAQAAAQALGANMVVFNDATENANVAAALASSPFANSTIWIGYKRNGVAGATFRTLDGTNGSFTPGPATPAFYQNWAGGEPNNNGYQDCVGGCGSPFCSDQYRCNNGEECVQVFAGGGQWNDLPCDRSSISVIEVNLCPIVTTNTPAAICVGQSTTLQATTLLGSTPYTYTWDNGAGSGAQVNVSPQVNTTYTVSVTDRYNCTADTTVTVAIDPNCSSPSCDLQAIRNAFAAAGGYVELNVQGQDCSLYFVNTRSQDADQSQQQAAALGANMVVFNDAAENTNVAAALAATPYANSAIWIGYKRTGTAQPTFFTLDGTSGPFNPGPSTPTLYQNWNGGEPNNNGYQDCFGGCGFIGCDSYRCNNGEQCVQVFAGGGQWNDLPCDRSSISVVEVNLCPQLSITVNGGTVCAGTPVQISASTLLGSAPYDYIWSTQQTGATVTVTPAASTTYSVSVTDRYDCIADTSALITVNPSVTTDFTVTTPICPDEVSTITYTGSVPSSATYNWSFDGGNIVSGSGQGPYTISWTTDGVKNVSLDITAPQGFCPGTPTTVPVTVNPFPVANAGADVTVCSGGTVQIGAASVAGETYTWTPATNLSNAAIANPDFRGSNAGSQPVATTYFLTTTSAAGCEDRDTVTVTIDPAQLLNVTAGGPTQFCEGQNVTLTADPGLNNYTWQDAVTGDVRVVTDAGSYIVTAQDANGCEFISGATAIIVFDKPVIDTTAFQNVSCFGLNDGTATFETTGGTPTYQYFQTPNTPLQSNTLNGLAPGTYEVYVVDGAQCADSIAFEITEPAAPLDINLLALQNVTCFGYSDGSINVEAVGGTPNYTFTWSNGTATSVNSGLPIGNYSVTATDNNGCTTDTAFTLTQPDELFVSVPDSVEVLLGNSIVLEPVFTDNQPYNFLWEPDLFLNNNSITNPTATPNLTTTYTVTMSDTNQCFATDTITVFVNDSIKIYIPNIFSPNGDGINDVFRVYANAVKDFYMIIYNRWGEKVFESKDMFAAWNGSRNGKELEVGVYVYQVQFTFLNFTQQKKKGSVTLAR